MENGQGWWVQTMPQKSNLNDVRSHKDIVNPGAIINNNIQPNSKFQEGV